MRALLALALLLCGSAFAAPHEKIVNGFVDGNDHLYGCAFVSRGNRGQFYAHCSCALIDPTHAITAGHCDWGGPPDDYQVNVTVSAVIDPRGEWKQMVHGRFYRHPEYSDSSSAHDLAVIVLDKPIRAPIDERLALRISLGRGLYAQLPRLNQLDAEHSTFTAVGYGVTDHRQDANDFATTRRFATERYKSRNSTSFATEPMPGLGCWSDSGSAVYFGTSNIIAGVLSFADDGCDSWNLFARLDVESNLKWVLRFVQ